MQLALRFALPMLAVCVLACTAARAQEAFGTADPFPAAAPKPAFVPYSVQHGFDLESLPPLSLPPIDAARVAAEDARRAAEGDKVLRYGVRRELAGATSLGAWHELGDGARLWTLDLVSEGAFGLRVHLANLDLPDGARVIVWSPDSSAPACGPYASSGPFGNGEVWTPTRFSARVRVEYFEPKHLSASPPFAIDALQHGYRDPPPPPQFGGSSSCHNDVTCFDTWANPALAVGGIGFINTDALYCTGTLLTSLASDLTPYWLTAHHCVPTNGEAQSSEIFWKFQTSACDASPPSIALAPQSATCTLLATSAASDSSLLMVEGALPPGLYWAGWTALPAANGTSGACIHHPQGAYKRISFGTYDASFGCGGASHHRVLWTSGPTEPGSSGAPFFRADTQQVLGQLHCGPSSCGNVTDDQFGRFAETYAGVAGFLAGGGDDVLEPNDACASARLVTSATHQNLVVKSTDEDWYRIHVPSSGQLSVTLAFTHANGDVDLRLHSACGGALLASSTGAVDGESITWANPGPAQDVYWRVYLYSDTRNTYSMTVSLPVGIANDACLGAIPLSSIASGSTVGATNSVAGSCGQSATSPDVWYAYVASSTGMLSLSTCGSSFDTVVSAYDACGGTELGCNDDAALGAPCGVNTVQSYLSLPTTAGAAYVIRVSGFNGATGSFTLRAENASGVAFCLGDGFSAAQCPCANNSAASAVAGCVSSLGTPGKLTSTGVPRVSSDSIVLRGSGMPDSTCLYFQGDARQANGAGVELGDGLRCAGGLAIRLGAKTNQAGASTFPALLGGDPPVHVKGLIPAAGATRFYQAWYRNSAEFCTESTFNLTNGYQLTWLP